MLLLQLRQIFRSKIFFVFNNFHYRVALFQKLFVIFFHTFLAKNQKGCFSALEVGLSQCIGNELCFAAFQKAVNHIYGFHTFQVSLSQDTCRLSPAGIPYLSRLLIYFRKRSASLSSSILEPMTQSLPVTCAAPLRISLSPGT